MIKTSFLHKLCPLDFGAPKIPCRCGIPAACRSGIVLYFLVPWFVSWHVFLHVHKLLSCSYIFKHSLCYYHLARLASEGSAKGKKINPNGLCKMTNPMPILENYLAARHHQPLVLLLGRADTSRSVAEIAAASGFKSIQAPWSQCERYEQRVVVRDAYEVFADGRTSLLPGLTLLTPALIVVLAEGSAALARGRDLVVSSSALWSHCELLQSETPTALRNGDVNSDAVRRPETQVECVAYGVIEFYSNPPMLRLAAQPGVLVASGRRPWSAVDYPELPRWEQQARQVFATRLSEIAGRVTAKSDSILHRLVAPCAVLFRSPTEHSLIDPFSICVWQGGGQASWRGAMKAWLQHVYRRTEGPEPLSIPDPRIRTHSAEGSMGPHDCAGVNLGDHTIGMASFPKLFGTSQFIETELIPNASFVYLDPELEPTTVLDGEELQSALRRILCRRRCAIPSTGQLTEQRLVEPGVGRACLVQGIRSRGSSHFHEFTVLGIGLTPFSEGGYVEIGRKIDGKASLFRAWHRKTSAERLEAQGCRTGRVVAIVLLPGEDIEMPDGTFSPSALIVRGFRCAYRIKQLDPLVCCLHSIQHTPLVGAYLMRRARELRLSEAGGLADDELLARSLEMQGASQESLRALLAVQPRDYVTDWSALVMRVRLEVIDMYVPVLVGAAKRRLARELEVMDTEVRDVDYLTWFAESVGAQLKTWRHLRFLHDYHQPGVSRWKPGHLYTLGENNVTLLAEFPDLDTGVFVEDDEEHLTATLQLTTEDVAVLRERYLLFHQRDVEATETVLRTLGTLLFRAEGGVVETAVARFRRSYADA
jgi:hypothetical protein